jgi:hypothetical protein
MYTKIWQGLSLVTALLGWQAHQIAKQVHRGDYIGLSGRWMDLAAGLSLAIPCTLTPSEKLR